MATGIFLTIAVAGAAYFIWIGFLVCDDARKAKSRGVRPEEE